MENITKAEKDAFWRRVSQKGDDQCWEWTGAVESSNRRNLDNKRPVFRVNVNGNQLAHQAHIFSWRLHHGFLPQTLAPKLLFRNLCGDNLCVNPRHWQPITSAEDTFWLYVVRGNTPDDCWQWAGYTESTRMGYGRFKFNRREYRAHRFSYELHKGVIPDGLSVLHSCHNPECTNPRHLRVGTAKDNVQDAILAGRNAKGDTVAQKGSKHWKSILTEEQVTLIRENPWKESRKELSQRFGVSVACIHNVIHGRQWKHV